MKFLSEEEMQNYSAVKVSMKSESYITLDKSNNAMKVSTVNLQWIVKKLMYIAYETWSNIVFMIECLSQNLINIRIEHIKITKWVIQYLKETTNYDLRYRSKLKICTNQNNTVAYSYVNNNYAENVMNWKFTMNYVFMLNSNVTAWMSKKQYTMSTSTTEVKYIALEHGAQQKVWMQRFINELKLNNAITSITLLNNNESSIKLVHNVKQHSCTKHIDVQHHYIWNMINDKELIVKWVATKNILMNELTKMLTKNMFQSHCQQLKIVQLDETDRQRE